MTTKSTARSTKSTTKKRAQPDAPKRGPGRPRKDPGEVKRQVAFFLNDEERSMLKEMARLWGCTTSQFLANLVRETYRSRRYMKGFSRLSQEERADLISQRQTTSFITACREKTAMQRNIDRRMGMDRSLTNVMVIAAPQAVTQRAVRESATEVTDGINIPGIYCKNLGDVWIVPYGQLYRISVVEIIQYPCYASVLDYFAGKRIAPGLLSDFIERQHDFQLSSMGEKAVQERLAKVYGTMRYPVKESFELKRRERMLAEAQQSMEQALRDLTSSGSALDQIYQNAAQEAEAFESSAAAPDLAPAPAVSAAPAPVGAPEVPAAPAASTSDGAGAAAVGSKDEPEQSAPENQPQPESAQPSAQSAAQVEAAKPQLEVVVDAAEEDEAPFLAEVEDPSQKR